MFVILAVTAPKKYLDRFKCNTFEMHKKLFNVLGSKNFF